ncbi:MAG: DUF3516 domain-containing protein [Myxococcales bacterium]|nr:DUF3516 domain-containing protein [Myxococcales bacterium]
MTTPLYQRLPAGPITQDALLEIFVEWVVDLGIELYPAQEEAILEIFAGRHIILNTPTGSGKSLVALAMHFRAFATGRRSVYTSPIKALVSEKFFDLCKQFGAENVGMLTGDASINHDAPVLACTAEVLAAMALSEGDAAGVHYAIMDEFHYYADRERGMAWQIPLLTLGKTTFMLMSATLGDTREIAERLEARTGRSVALIQSVQRPVPLEFSYRTDPLHETIADLLEKGQAPVYVVNFTHREVADLAQALMSVNFASKVEKAEIAAELAGFRFDTPYGKVVRRYVNHGLGIHHAGLLPKYRLLVERLAQKGMLKIIVGTDTLGVGINVPIRTVLFTKLCKYDGQKTRLLSVRDFKQIAGRAGRKGFDDRGWVVCEAPEHVIENMKLDRKAEANPKLRKKMVKKKPPDRGYVHWDEETFAGLAQGEAEALTPRFAVDHGMIINLLQRGEVDRRGGYGALIGLIAESHTRPHEKAKLRREAKGLFRSLVQAGVVETFPRGPGRRGQAVRVTPDLQKDFSIYHSLSLFLLYAVGQVSPQEEHYALRILTLVESILEDPHVVLRAQQQKLRDEKYQQLKAEGAEYEVLRETLDKVTWPMPDADFVFEVFDAYASSHPWVRAGDLRPKSVVRDMYERYATFGEYVRHYGLPRAEGVLLRHISQTYKALVQSVPDSVKDDRVYALIGYVRALLRADSSLLQTWEAMKQGEGTPLEGTEPGPAAVPTLLDDPRLFRARLRAELHAFVKALADRDYEEAADSLRTPADPDEVWDAERLEKALAPFYAAYDRIRFDHDARNAKYTRLVETGPRQWTVTQVLCDDEGDDMWFAEGVIDLRDDPDPAGPLVALTRLES